MTRPQARWRPPPALRRLEKLQDTDRPTRLHDAHHLHDRRCRVCRVPQPEGVEAGVERGVGEWEMQRIGGNEGDPLVAPQPHGGERQHLRHEVADDHRAEVRVPSQTLRGQVRGARANIQRPRAIGQIESGNQTATPHPVEAAAEKVV